MIDTKLRWNRSPLLSYNCYLSMAVGARNIGKSYQAKDWALTIFKNCGMTTKWVMRYGTELEKALKENDFLAGLYDPWLAKGFEIWYDETGVYVKRVGEEETSKVISFQTLSERALKGSDDPHCKLIVFDEFIPLPGTPYLKGEVSRFLEYIFTVHRERGGRVLLLANNVTPISPYFSYFRAVLPRKGEFYHDPVRGLVIENCRNEEFAQVMKQTNFGKLVAGTDYEAYAIENNSLVDLHTFVVDRLPHNARPCVRISTEHGMLWLWLAPPGILFVHTTGPASIHTFAMDDVSHKEDTVRGDFAGAYARKLLRLYHHRSMLYFTSDRAKGIFLQSCQHLLK